MEHLLDSLTVGARAEVIVLQSSVTGKTKDEKAFKANIMKHHTLEGVITCNTNTFYGALARILSLPCLRPMNRTRRTSFVSSLPFRKDGYKVHAHVGLVERGGRCTRQEGSSAGRMTWRAGDSDIILSGIDHRA